jgi:YhcH/YjgK/YiaL family protein
MTNCKAGLDIDKWSDQQVNEYFHSSVWYSELPFKPDESINKRIFIKQNMANESAWESALNFLKKNDLNQLSPGRYELSDDGTYATISEYQTKEADTAQYEAHRKYIDIQYVIDGEEYMEIIPLAFIKEDQNYDPNADIMFFKDQTKGEILYADKTHFFVFFPEDVHKPCLKIDAVKNVRKLVIKIPFTQ